MSPVKRLLKLTKLFEIKVRWMQINDPVQSTISSEFTKIEEMKL
jgi:hypothetical protein